jgi:hypothetical protein
MSQPAREGRQSSGAWRDGLRGSSNGLRGSFLACFTTLLLTPKADAPAKANETGRLHLIAIERRGFRGSAGCPIGQAHLDVSKGSAQLPETGRLRA